MRLWSVHPEYLDTKGLVALWREGLLAQKVLLGQTRGYTRHPQLIRFRAVADPVAVVGTYLREVVREAERRGYRFDESKIVREQAGIWLGLTLGQIGYEWDHLLAKLAVRSPTSFERHRGTPLPQPHPLFRLEPGPIQDWERP